MSVARSLEAVHEESLDNNDEAYKIECTLNRTHLDAESKYNDDLSGVIQMLEEKQLSKSRRAPNVCFCLNLAGKDELAAGYRAKI